jgi:hypothetical protein
MIEDYYVYIFSSVFATVGFLARYIWEFMMARRKRELTEKINKIEFKLKEFYYPIFFYLKREQIIWDKILKLHTNPKPSTPPIKILPASKRALRSVYLTIHNPETNEIENNQTENSKIPIKRESTIHLDIIKALDEENLKIHKYVQDLIHNKICIAVPPKELIDLFLQYDEHVTVYQILRQIEIYDKFPIQYGTPYPQTLMQKIEERIIYLNTQYHKYNKRLG